jgi:antitoxin component YwqK of YwqJK toxin-antitoxin module
MILNYILSDILQYIFNEYIDHYPEEIVKLEKTLNFKFNTNKYIEEKWKNGKRYKNGKLQGKQYKYHPNGSVYKIQNYCCGVKKGPQIKYNLDGSHKSSKFKI